MWHLISQSIGFPIFFAVFLAVQLVSCGPSFPGSADLVTDPIPGISAPNSLVHYSGYLSVLNGVQLHYWFFESDSSPENDPIVLWLHGGPGCSSMLGALTEHGPIRLEKNGDVKFNEYSWNRNASILYMESPAGVGYSYNTSNLYYQNDESTAELNHEALKAFFAKFPQFKKNRFFISGESYAGIYLPMLAERLIKDKNFVPKLKGMLIGNGYLDVDLIGNSLYHYRYYHGILDRSYYQPIIEKCCKNVTNLIDCKIVNSDDRDCRAATERSLFNQYILLNIYNINGKCYAKRLESENDEKLKDYSYEHFGMQLIHDQSGLSMNSISGNDNAQANTFKFYHEGPGSPV